MASSPAVRIDHSPVHGRGVFAIRAIESGEQFCTNPLFRIPAKEREFLDQTSLYDHYFEFEEDAYIAFGAVSFLNHDEEPAADFELNIDDLTITLTARRDIRGGEEVTIHYGVPPWW